MARPPDDADVVGEVGTSKLRAKAYSAAFGQELPLDYQIVQYDPPSRVVLEAENDNLRSVDTITFEKTARGARLTYDANLTLKGIRYVGDFALHLAFQWIGRRALEGLRAALDEDRASYSSRAAAARSQ